LPIEWLPRSGPAQQLIVLLHGWADRAASFTPLAEALRAQFPQAAILAPESPQPADGGRPGRQWYSTAGIQDDPSIWRERVDTCVAHLGPWLRAQQERLHVSAAATALGGFSQGGVLALHTATAFDGIAGRVLAFGARMVQAPETPPRQVTLHLFHGAQDRIFPIDQASQLKTDLEHLQADVSLDIAEQAGHALHPELITFALQRLTRHIPARTWREALGGSPLTDSPAR
jgi:phospholipase/carboxylesterase